MGLQDETRKLKKQAVVRSLEGNLLSLKQAFLLCDVAPSTGFRWLQEDPHFKQACAKAKATVNNKLIISGLEKGLKKGEGWAVTFAARGRMPDEWGEKQTVEHEPIKIEITSAPCVTAKDVGVDLDAD